MNTETAHVVLWIVDDPDAWARAVEADGDAEPGRWPKSRRYIGEQRRTERYASAAQIRATGPCRDWYTICHDAAAAGQVAAELRRSHPNPGVRYETAPVPARTAANPAWKLTGRYVTTPAATVPAARPPRSRHRSGPPTSSRSTSGWGR